MNVEEFKRNLQNIFGEQIRFSVDFDVYAEEIKNIDDDFMGWCIQLKEKKIDPIPAKRKYKDHLVFVKRMGSSNRCIVIKIKMPAIQINKINWVCQRQIGRRRDRNIRLIHASQHDQLRSFQGIFNNFLTGARTPKLHHFHINTISITLCQ